MSSKVIGIRLWDHDIKRLENLCQQSGMTKTDLLVTLLRNVEEVQPPVEASVRFSTLEARSESAQHA